MSLKNKAQKSEMINAVREDEATGELIYMQDQIMESILGRPLDEDEFVLHKNGDSLDNRSENLILATDPGRL